MVNRNFDMATISDITNNLSDKFKNNLNGVTTTSSDFFSGVTGKPSPDSVMMNNEVAGLLNDMCHSKSISGADLNYLKNLQRLLNGKNGMTLCNSANASILDKVIMGSTMMNGSRKGEYKTLINKAIGSQLGAFGYNGPVPKCMYDKLEGSLGKLLGGLNGNHKLKLNLMDYVNNQCLKDIL